MSKSNDNFQTSGVSPPTTAGSQRHPDGTNGFHKTLLGVVMTITMGGSSLAMADLDPQGKNFGHWKLSGFDTRNTGDSSRVSRLNLYNFGDLELQWIYSIPTIPIGPPVPCDYSPSNPNLPCPIPLGANPSNQPRPYYGVGSGVSVDRKGRVYFPAFDGRMYVLDANTTIASPNPLLTTAPSPVNLLTMDFFSDPKYIIPDQLPEENVYISRTFPTLIGNSVFAGGYSIFAVRTQDGTNKFNTIGLHASNPSHPYYESPGAVLYNIDRRTGDLIWKTVVDSQGTGGIPITGVTPIHGSIHGPIIVVPFQTSANSGNLGLYPISPDPYQNDCCSSRGGLAGIRLKDGKVVWKTYTMPQQNFDSLAQIIANGKVNAWTGGNTWGGGNLPYSKKLGLVFAGTSEGYSAPQAAAQCELNRLATPGEPLVSNKCLRYDQSGLRTDLNFNRNFSNNVLENTAPITYSPTLPLVDAIYAVDVNTGKIKWAQPTHGFDIWNTSCLAPFGGPPFNSLTLMNLFCGVDLIANPLLNLQTKDGDSATPPTLIENVRMADGKVRDIVVGGGKESAMYAFDANTGAALWQPVPLNLSAYPTNVPAGVHFGKGGIDGGGFAWGFAHDGKRVYGVTGASSDVSLADWKTAKNGGPNPKKIVVNSCIESGFFTPFPTDPDQSDSNKVWGGSNYFPADDPTDPVVRGAGSGGMYVAVDLATGKIAWQRCALGLQGNPNRPLATVTPIQDCLNSQALPVAPAVVPAGDTTPYRDYPYGKGSGVGQCRPRSTNAPPSVSNGVLAVGGANNSQDGQGAAVQSQVPFPEVLLLNAQTGNLLRELPMGKLGEPSANPVIYSRTISVGRNLFIASGSRKVSGGQSPGQIDGTRDFYRVIMYQLKSDQDDYCDDHDDDEIHQDDE